MKDEKNLKGHKTLSEAFTSASFGNPLTWLSPRKLRVNSELFFLDVAKIGEFSSV